MSVSARQWLEPDEIASLRQPSTARGLASVAMTWTTIALTLAIVAIAPHPAVVIAALIVLGGQQMALAVLMHECAHRSLVRGKALNRAIGVWLTGAPIGFDVDRYRGHHLKHHGHTGTEADPDLVLTAPFPTTRAGMWRKIARDLSGLAGLRRAVALVLMATGALSYTASSGAQWLGWPRLTRAWCALVARRLGPLLLTQAALLGVCWLCGAPWLYAIWALAWLTSFSLIFRLRAIAEHACTERGDDVLRNTRTVRAGPLARVTVAPHHVNYHIEHHLLMTVPHYRLPALHQLLSERGALAGAQLAPGYLEVWREAFGVRRPETD